MRTRPQIAALNVKGTPFDKVVEKLGPLGMYTYARNEAVSGESADIFASTLSREEQVGVRNGSLRVVPRETQRMTDGRNDLEIIDADVMSGPRVETYDPLLIFRGPDAIKLRNAAKELLQEPVTIDVIKNGMLYGIESPEFVTSVQDLARLQDVSYNEMYEICVNKMINGNVLAMKNRALTAPKTRTTQKTRRIPQRPIQKVAAI